MKKNLVKELLMENKVALGTWLALGSPIVAEIISSIGFDWVVIDTEHASIDIETTQSMIQAMSGTATVPMVRVSWNDPALIKRALDAGAYGLVIPMVNTKEEAARAVQASRYPPMGIRSYGGPRVRLYGGDDYFCHANEEIALIVQIEHITAVENIDEILSVEGVDAFFIGPMDLAASMGIKLRLDNPDPRFNEAVDKALEAGKKHNVPGGIFVSGPEAANQRISQGFRLVSLSSDDYFLANAVSAAFNNVLKVRDKE